MERRDTGFEVSLYMTCMTCFREPVVGAFGVTSSARHGSLGAMEQRHNLQREEAQPEL